MYSRRVGEAVVAGGLAAGGDHRIVVQADEAEVGQGPEPGLALMAGDLVVAGRDALRLEESSGLTAPDLPAGFRPFSLRRCPLL